VNKALAYLKSDRSDAAKEDIKERDWNTVKREKAITILEMLIEQLDHDNRTETYQLDHDNRTETYAVEEEPPKRKPGRFMGVAGLAPDYEERTGTY
jgi:uncharacterized membrane protein YgaE (UPF0421/DUF939 family)